MFIREYLLKVNFTVYNDMVCLYVGLFVYFCGSKVLRIQVVKQKAKRL